MQLELGQILSRAPYGGRGAAPGRPGNRQPSAARSRNLPAASPCPQEAAAIFSTRVRLGAGPDFPALPVGSRMRSTARARHNGASAVAPRPPGGAGRRTASGRRGRARHGDGRVSLTDGRTGGQTGGRTDRGPRAGPSEAPPRARPRPPRAPGGFHGDGKQSCPALPGCCLGPASRAPGARSALGQERGRLQPW